MFMILAHHFAIHNGDPIDTVGSAMTRAVLRVLCIPMGRTGVTLFVMITAWFLADREGALRDSVNRIIKLDGKLIIYSIALYIITILMGLNVFDPLNTILSCFPLTVSKWWFMTDYAFFIILTPFLFRGLRALTKNEHRSLSLFLILSLGILQCIPYVQMPAITGNLMIQFISLAIVTLYIKWYKKDHLAKISNYVVALMGAILLIAYCYWVSNKNLMIVSELASTIYTYSYINPVSILALSIAYPMFMIAIMKQGTSNKTIIFLASHATAVYLITDYEPMRKWLWQSIFTFSNVAKLGISLILSSFLILIVIYIAAILIDVVIDGTLKLSLRKIGAFKNQA